MTSPAASVRWRRLDIPGNEVARLTPQGDGHRLAGVATFTEEGLAVVLEYHVDLDAQWRTRACSVKGSYGDQPVNVMLRADGTGNWWQGDQPCPDVAGCLDIDLAFSPSTNPLPIRRLALPVGAGSAVTAAWLTVPGFRLERLEQEYQRVSQHTYHYRAGDFTAELRIRDDGFVESYSGLWLAIDE